MPIYKPKDSKNWWVDIYLGNGKRIRRSAKTADKKKAQEYHDHLKAQHWRQERLGEDVDIGFEQAALAMLKLAEQQTTFDKKLTHVEYWLSHFKGRSIRSLKSQEILDALPKETNYVHQQNHAIANATKNRYLATMQMILSVAFENGWISKKPKLPKYKEAAERVKWLRKEQAIVFLQKLSKPWVRQVSSFALSTGMRVQEIMSLEWSDVDMEREVAFVVANKSKNRKPRAVPLNSEALAVLRAEQGKSWRWVFVNPKTGKPYNKPSHKDLKQAFAFVGADDFHFHDLRHTWASWHVQNGTPLLVLKELGGWRTLAMVQKYAHLAVEHLAVHTNNVLFMTKGL